MPTDHEIVMAMDAYGGSFIQALAALWGQADPVNRERIKAAWPEYWQEYAEMAEARRRHDPR